MRSRYARRTRRYGRRGPARRRPVRRYPLRRRAPRMSRRRILNIASQKKIDNMLPASVSTGGTITPGTFVATAGSTPVYCLFSPTQRNMAPAGITGGFTYYNSNSLRTSTTTYAKGYREKINIIYDNLSSWSWRRVVFSFKADPTLGPGSPFNISSVAGTTNNLGYQTARQLNALTTTSVSAIQDMLFRGNFNVDWLSSVTAPLDHTRVKVHSDTIKSLQSPSGTVNSYNTTRYYPLNRTLTYVDDERGVGEQPFYWASSDPKSMGDLYVLDIFLSASTTGGQLNFSPEGTYYWHER